MRHITIFDVTVVALCMPLVAFSQIAQPKNPLAVQNSQIQVPAYRWVEPDSTAVKGASYRLYPTPHRGENTKGSYLVYLPEQYFKESSKRFPVIYWLHGGFGSQREAAYVALSGFEKAMKKGSMPPCIIIFPQALPGGWYCNSKDGQRPVEDVVVKDLIPEVDCSYRTIADSRHRGLEGMSMGGYGVLHLGFKYPMIFGVLSSVAPSIQPSLAQEEGLRTKDTFFDDEAYYEECSPQGLLRNNHSLLTSNAQKIRIWCGSEDGLEPVVELFSRQMDSLNISHEFKKVKGASHDYLEIIKRINNPYTFWKEAFEEKNGDGE